MGCDSSSVSFVVAGQRASVSQSYCAAGEHDSLLVHRADQGQEVSAGKPHSFEYQNPAHETDPSHTLGVPFIINFF